MSIFFVINIWLVRTYEADEVIGRSILLLLLLSALSCYYYYYCV